MANLKGDGKAIFNLFIGAIITITLIAVIANSVFTQTNTDSVVNQTVTGAAVDTALDLTGRDLLTTVVIVNASNGSQTLVGEGGLLQTGTSATTGLRTVQLVLNATAAGYVGESVNVSYTYEPDGYIQSSSGRSITNLIILFGALAILIFAIVAFVMDGSLGKFVGKR